MTITSTTTDERCMCREHDSELWFPTPLPGRRRKPDVDPIDTGVDPFAICAGCPVNNTCLIGALERGEQYGIWGGIDMASPRGRTMLRNHRRARRSDNRAS